MRFGKDEIPITDRIKFECYAYGATFGQFREFSSHIGEHLRIQSAPLRTMRRTVRANKIMISKSEPRETGAGHFPYLFEKVTHE